MDYQGFFRSSGSDKISYIMLLGILRVDRCYNFFFLSRRVVLACRMAVHADDKTVLSVALDLCLCDLSFPSLKSRCEMSSISSAQTMEHDMLLLQNSNSFIQETNLMVLRHSGAKVFTNLFLSKTIQTPIPRHF
ncbi:Glypican-3 [Dirofilaria immitis]